VIECVTQSFDVEVLGASGIRPVQERTMIGLLGHARGRCCFLLWQLSVRPTVERESALADDIGRLGGNSDQSMKLRRTDCVIMLVLGSITAALFAQSMRFDYTYYDDPDYTFRDDHVPTGLNAASVKHAFSTWRLANWHPLTWLSYMLDVQLFGMTARAFHRTNVLLHGCNAMLLYLALAILAGSRWRSVLAAAVFALHPLRVESVAWIAERKDVLSTFFGLLTLLAYAGYARRGGAARYILVVLPFVLCLLSKPMLVTLPIVLLLLDWWPLKRLAGALALRALLEKIPLFVLATLSMLMTLRAAGSASAILRLGTVSFEARLANAIVSYARYLLDMIWPAKLVVLYPFSSTLPLATIAAAAVLLILITAIAIRMIARMPHLLVGWLWYLVTLLPVIGLVAVGEQSRADRYTYFAMIGILIMVVWSIPQPRTTARTWTVAGTSVVVLAVLCALTAQQLQYWRNSQTLFERTLVVSGPNATIHLNYAGALADAGQWDRAIEQYRAAALLKPNWAPIPMGIGVALSQQGNHEQAAGQYRESIRLNPNDPIAWMNYGLALAHLKQYPESEAAFRRAMQIRSGFAAAKQNLDEVLRLQNKPAE
jgi:tetratricopeptide (TPR) repeat protein